MSTTSLAASKLYDLTGLVALVTGGGTGIGLMISYGLAANGAKVYITGRRLEVLQKVADGWSKQTGAIVALQMDATNKESILAARDAIESKEGRLHILVNNAGQVGPTSPFFNDLSAPEHKDAETLGRALFENESFEQWSSLYNINTFSIFFVTTAFVGLLTKGSQEKESEGFTSSVINTTSISGIIKVAQNHFCYNSAKAAASHLTKMLSTEFALKGIPVRVNAIAPGVYASEMTFDSIPADVVDKIGKGVHPVPAKRAGTAEEMAGTAVYLASLAGCYTNGQEIVIDVLMVEKGPEEWVGGNGYFTAGAHRTVHQGLHDLLPLVKNVSPEEAVNIDLDPYTAQDFTGDIMRLGDGKSDPSLVRAVVEGSRAAIEWRTKLVRGPLSGGGLVLSVEDGGKGLIAAHRQALHENGVEVWFDSPAVHLLAEGETNILGIEVRKNGNPVRVKTSAVVLAAGGFEANKDMLQKHLGANWGRARVRGTPFNIGDGFTLAAELNARITGDWAGCHSTCWDANANPDSGDRDLTNQFTKSGYPLGIMVNAHGLRFVDEGEDFRNYTYAKFGRAILNEPGGYAFQIWDSKMVPYLRKEEYGEGVVQKIVGEDMHELIGELQDRGLQDPVQFIQTIQEYNAAVNSFNEEQPKKSWNPAIKDGLSTQSSKKSLELPKSNWAQTIDAPPFTAVKVACGVTFTFGGLAIDPNTANVISDVSGQPIQGLFCTGEMVGGLFYNNYPGGSGLTAGAVFGRKAGEGAARLAIRN
ncbi:hypothetical protein ONZ45_g3993 [Pleurotus djamor]|nr:hypothetical protein ONZ45_g3993 [Pleurotus djamor]